MIRRSTTGVLAVLAFALAGCAPGPIDGPAVKETNYDGGLPFPTDQASLASPEPTTAETSSEAPIAGPTEASTASSATPTPTEDPCSTLTEAEAVQIAADSIPIPSGFEDMTWSLDRYDASTFDSCAELSAVRIELEQAGHPTAPLAVAFFHDGELVATIDGRDPQGQVRELVRIDDATIEVNFRFWRENECTACASGYALSTFTWDAASTSVSREDTIPNNG